MFDIAPRVALAAPTDPGVIRVQSAVIMVASILACIGAGWIMASFLAFSNLRTFRHQLIFGLAISDCVMALNFLVSSSMNVSGRWIGAPENARFCSFNGFMTQVFVIQTDYWVLTIAVCTYFVLADHKRSSSWVQDHLSVIWALPWLLSITWAAIGLGVTGYGDIGAWCWFASDEVRLLVNFVPRWVIVTAMFFMYARLYFLLFRAHRHMASLEASGSLSGSDSRQLDTNGHTSSQQETSGNTSRHTRKLKKLARLMLLYPLAYAVIWSLPTTIRIYQTITGEPAPWQIQTLDKACIVAQGFVDAVIYGATESSLSSWRNLFFPRRFPILNGNDGMVAPATTYGDVSNKDTRRRRYWNCADGWQLVSRASTRHAALAASSIESADSLEIPAGDQVELRDLEGGTRDKGIRKTVEVRVMSTIGRETQLAVPRPTKPYFPGDQRDT